MGPYSEIVPRVGLVPRLASGCWQECDPRPALGTSTCKKNSTLAVRRVKASNTPVFPDLGTTAHLSFTTNNPRVYGREVGITVVDYAKIKVHGIIWKDSQHAIGGLRSSLTYLRT